MNKGGICSPDNSFRVKFYPLGKCLNFPPSSEFINKKLFRSQFLFGWKILNKPSPTPILHLLYEFMSFFLSTHNTTKANIEKKKAILSCVFTSG